MSKLTNPETESSVSCGFYNSLGDRKYDAVQMSSLFDGLIHDGIFRTIGKCFEVTVNSGNIVNVGPGKCWFNHTWTKNDATLPLDCGESEIYLNRYDAVVIEVNSTTSVRDNFIKVIHGTPATQPARPSLINNETIHQHALAYIYRAQGSTEISQSDITSMIGDKETPFVTGIAASASRDDWAAQWRTELDEFMASEKSDLARFMTSQEEDFNQWYSEMKELMENAITETVEWTESHKATILEWFEDIKGILSEDATIALQLQISSIDVARLLQNGFSFCRKEMSTDGKVIASYELKPGTTEVETGRRIVKTFSDDFSECSIVLYDANDTELGRLDKTFSTDGTVITSLGNGMFTNEVPTSFVDVSETGL